SAINAMVYIRGHRSDYDQWAALGNPGWSFSDVLPYFKRSEDNADFDGEYHGKGGPLAVNKLRTDNPVQQNFLQAVQEGQFRVREDFNADEHEGLGIYQVTQKNGERWSAARAYLHPHMGNRANLRVETHAHATRILLKAWPRLLRAIDQYRRDRPGPMTSNFAECGGFLKTHPDLGVPDIQLHFGMALADDHGRKRHRGTGFTCHVCVLRPKSRGHVGLSSADPLAPPLIDPNFFGDAADLETMVAGFKVTRR